jgi:hypothetical protein
VRDKGAEALVVTALDEIAWLLNIRGGDVEFNPVSISYAGARGPPMSTHTSLACFLGHR